MNPGAFDPQSAALCSPSSPGRVAPTVDRTAPWRVHEARLLSIRSEISAVVTYEMAFVDPALQAKWEFLPGQFHMFYLPGFGESAISISSDPARRDRFAHTIRAVGNVTRHLTRLQPGDSVLLRGPFGSAWPAHLAYGQDLVIAAGGLGLAPLRPVVYQVLRERDRFRQVWLLYGARTPADLLYADEFASWRDAGIELLETVDFGDATWQGPIGVVPTLLHRLPIRQDQTWVMTCGPEIMMRFVVQESRAMGIPASRVYASLERNMSCAVGFCGHCQFGPNFVCKDGPVFRYDQIESFLHIEDF